ncbi:MAG: hypothetical protein QOD72_234 [Acidimicrobiaceae bacterium]|nr:hypothetical protein [Acidimicrobiaceae bacterium]
MIVGVGYEGMTIDGFIADLVSRRIALVVDVRLNAVSRKPGFSRRALAAALEGAGIGYRHEPTLGNPRDNRDGFGAGDPAALAVMRARVATVGAEAMGRLAAESRRRRVAVLCFEHDEHRCHRRVIIDALRTGRTSSDA